MRLQCFAAAHDWTVVGEITIQKDKFARYYADGARIALVRQAGVFSALVCADGRTFYVMTRDWGEVGRLPPTYQPAV